MNSFDNKSRKARVESDLRYIEAQIKKNNSGPRRSVIRGAHNYEWFGLFYNAEESIKYYKIAAKCIDLEEQKYKCYAPDPDYDDCCICFETTEENLEQRLKSHPRLKDFIIERHISLVDFMLMEIPEKIYHLSNYFDLVEFLDLEGEESDAIPIEHVIEKIN